MVYNISHIKKIAIHICQFLQKIIVLLNNFVEKTAKVIVRSASARRDNLVRSTYLPQLCRTEVRRCSQPEGPQHDRTTVTLRRLFTADVSVFALQCDSIMSHPSKPPGPIKRFTN